MGKTMSTGLNLTEFMKTRWRGGVGDTLSQLPNHIVNADRCRRSKPHFLMSWKLRQLNKIQVGPKEAYSSEYPDPGFLLVLLFINYCIIVHRDNCKPIFSPP